MLAIGLNGVDGTFHDSSASIFMDGKLVFSIEEERLNRRKHSSGIPVLATRACLDFVGAKMTDVDAFGFYLDPEVLYQKYFLRTVREFWPASWRLFRAHRSFESIRSMGTSLRQALSIPSATPLYFFNHHLCHAASVAHFSGFEDAALLVIDGSGDDESASLFSLEHRSSLRKAATFANYPRSLGLFYAGIADYVGLGWVEGPGKLMGLAPYGSPRFKELLRPVLFRREVFDVDMRYFEYHLNGDRRLARVLTNIFGIPQRSPTEPLESIHADIAASAQAVLEDAVLFMAEMAKKFTQKPRLGYAGGVALNIDANSRISESGLFEDIVIHPAAYDGGTSIGAGYLAHIRRFGSAPDPSSEVFLGSALNTSDITQIAERNGLIAYKRDNQSLIRSAAQRLSNSQIVGWAEGRMEIGPRALTHRSILAHPGMTRDEVNRVKQRETFRPFAPIVLQHNLGKMFSGGPSKSPHMLFRYDTRPEYVEALQAVVHVDGSSRVQTIAPEDLQTHKAALLLSEFERITGLFAILNTSFNLRGQPLVADVEQIVQVVKSTELAAAYVGEYEIAKGPAQQ